MDSELISRLRTATVGDSAESLYQLMTDAADEIERLRERLSISKSLESSLSSCLSSVQREVAGLQDLVTDLMMKDAINELKKTANE